jgi:hypothetical protein
VDLSAIKDNIRIPTGIATSTITVIAITMCIQMRVASGVLENDLRASFEGESRDAAEVNIDFGIEFDGLNCGPMSGVPEMNSSL